jgi:hypothetical protein
MMGGITLSTRCRFFNVLPCSEKTPFSLSSEGNGKIARSCKGLVVLGLVLMFNADEGTALALADQLGTVLAGIYTLYGMGMKV